MKRVYKFICMLSVVLGLVFFSYSNAYASSDNAYTMDEIRLILERYLQESGQEIVFGSDEYNEYLIKQLIEGTDEKLKENENYDLILDYASIYLYKLQEKPSWVQTSGSDKTNYEDFKEKTIEELVKEIAADEERIASKPAPIDTIAPVSKYNINAATSYAKKWANGFNPNYKKQSNDCTNFVSQILSAGGLLGILPQHQLPNGINEDTDCWYYLGSNQMSTSFIRVVDFYSFYASRVDKKEITTTSNAVNILKEGDVVLLKRASTGARYHAIYISGKTNGKANYCGHTDPKKDENFANIDDSANNYTILQFHSYTNN